MSNYYPTKPPSYVPEGYRRRKSCGRLLKKDKHCICKTREQPNAIKPVKVTHVEPTAPKVEKRKYTEEERKAFADAVKKMSGKKPSKKGESSDILVCEDCGCAFDYPGNGRRARLCPACRKKQANARRRERKRVPEDKKVIRTIEEYTCVVCGKKQTRLRYGGEKPKYCCECRREVCRKRSREWRENRASSKP